MTMVGECHFCQNAVISHLPNVTGLLDDCLAGWTSSLLIEGPLLLLTELSTLFADKLILVVVSKGNVATAGAMDFSTGIKISSISRIIYKAHHKKLWYIIVYGKVHVNANF